MGAPRDTDARLFYRAARQRMEDARFLLDAGRTTAAVYMAGYCVECMMKALILSQAGDQKVAVLQTFRGARAHEYDWLRKQYADLSGPAFPADIVRAFASVNAWDTSLRYQPGTIRPDDAEAFVAAADTILTWADKRL